MQVPWEIANEWILFLDTKPSREETINWLTLKAMEIGWDFYDLSGCLMTQVKKAEGWLDEPERDDGPLN